ncbi:hypothetical protein QR680_001747 [Steinernema hermaphroditum]|uniref:Uncharacterized protein n=1 Tax=Steinernema hermaphroditum TaxID=289476 RepID=A0AA39LGQ1_9BILA|nr:hypothetical protein QR680_001747 [Steinernema hermaphroditum]
MARADDEEPFLSDGLEDIDEEFDEGAEQRRIVLHVYDDESKEFTSLTTYHGMVRIYNSNTWPSLIFWCLVVVTCVTLFMIHECCCTFIYLILLSSRRPFVSMMECTSLLLPYAFNQPFSHLLIPNKIGDFSKASTIVLCRFENYCLIVEGQRSKCSLAVKTFPTECPVVDS